MKFEPGEFVDLKRLTEARILPLSFEHARRLASQDILPAAKIAGQWHSTPEMCRSFLYKGLNKPARRLVA
jgi:hypothetical protein